MLLARRLVRMSSGSVDIFRDMCCLLLRLGLATELTIALEILLRNWSWSPLETTVALVRRAKLSGKGVVVAWDWSSG